jgi:hypothetical protein
MEKEDPESFWASAEPETWLTERLKTQKAVSDEIKSIFNNHTVLVNYHFLNSFCFGNGFLLTW